MPYDVNNWFSEQLAKPRSRPVRKFYIGTSDYSERILSWPKVKRTLNHLAPASVNVQLANTDGHFNGFRTAKYTMPNTCMLRMGFVESILWDSDIAWDDGIAWDGGEQLLTLYTGFLKDARYRERVINLTIRDRLYDLQDREVGESKTPVTFASTIPSDIAWTLCTCYGGLAAVESTSNPDIHYNDFLTWAGVFSADSVLCSARYEGKKVSEALERLCDYTHSGVWVGGDGKLRFVRFLEASSHDVLLTADHRYSMEINLRDSDLVNRQRVFFDYAPGSDYWQSTVTSQASGSVNSWGLHEATIKDETIWYVDSVSALSVADRMTALYQEPPQKFTIEAPMLGLDRELGETLRLVNSFYGVTSESGWRFVDMEINMANGKIGYQTDEAVTLQGFYLDIDALDGNARLL